LQDELLTAKTPHFFMKKNKYLLIFTLFVFLFFLWGFAHSILDVLNKHFQDIFIISKFRSTLVQVAVYGGYFLMALPAGLFIKKYSYQKSIILGLSLFAMGSFLFIPSEHFQSFGFFILSLFIIGCGLTFLETAANPYIITLGDPKTGASRLNFAQSFNGLGWIFGPMIGAFMIFNADGTSGDVSSPYILIGCVVLIVALLFIFIKLPKVKTTNKRSTNISDFKILFSNKLFLFGVLAQFLYVGAQTGINSFFINYVIELDQSIIPREAALILSFGGMGLFMIGRLSGSFIMKKTKPEIVLLFTSIAASILMIIVIFSLGKLSLIALFSTYFFMSIMFPTIFAISIQGLGEQTEKGSSLLVMSIVGGAIMPPLMGLIGNVQISIGFIIPLICFIGVMSFAIFKFKSRNTHE
jgi:FHS family L-fucose permease-like MFS transporter